MTSEEAIAYFKDMNECTYGAVEPIQMAIKALEAINQIYKITGGHAEELYYSEITYDDVTNILTDYFKEIEE